MRALAGQPSLRIRLDRVGTAQARVFWVAPGATPAKCQTACATVAPCLSGCPASATKSAARCLFPLSRRSSQRAALLRRVAGSPAAECTMRMGIDPHPRMRRPVAAPVVSTHSRGSDGRGEQPRRQCASCQSHCRFATTRVNGRQRLGGACTTHPCAAGNWSSATDAGFINVFWAWMTATPQLRHSNVSTASPQDREVTLAKRIGRSHEGQRVDRNWLMIRNIYAIWSEECEPDHTLRGDYGAARNATHCENFQVPYFRSTLYPFFY